jgi:hypothetical protein
VTHHVLPVGHSITTLDRGIATEWLIGLTKDEQAGPARQVAGSAEVTDSLRNWAGRTCAAKSPTRWRHTPIEIGGIGITLTFRVTLICQPSRGQA